MYFPYSENKGADQLRSYCEADLRLCFRIGKNLVFSRCGSYDDPIIDELTKYSEIDNKSFNEGHGLMFLTDKMATAHIKISLGIPTNLVCFK